MLVTDDDYLIVRAINGISHTLYRYRSEWAPFAYAASVAALGWWLHANRPYLAPLVGAATAAVSGLLSVAGARLRVKRHGWLGRRSERLYAACVVALAGGWLSAATAYGPARPPLPALGLVATVAAGIPWWAHHRRRARVRVERTLEAWPGVADAVGLAGAAVSSALVDAWGWTVRVALPRGRTVSEAIDRIPALESGLATRPGAIRIEPDSKRADWLLMRVVEKDPHAQPIPFPGRTHGSITRPVEIGLFEDAQPVTVLLGHVMTLIAGIVGSGKSGVVNVLMAHITACTDVIVVGVDLKGGMELGPWAPCLARLATNNADAEALMRDVVIEVNRRADMLTAQGKRFWEPSPTMPALIVVIDEYAELSDEAKECADSVARRGRAVAVTLLVATQRPTQSAMGHGAVRSQMDVRICLRVRERRDTDLILGQGMYEAGWHAHTLDAPGKFLISSPGNTTPKRARAYQITDDTVHAAVNTNRTTRPPLPAWTAIGANKTDPGMNIPAPRTPADDNPETVLWVALRKAPEDGVSIDDLMKQTGMSRRWVYYRLHQHAEAGRAIQSTRGRWRALPTDGDAT